MTDPTNLRTLKRKVIDAIRDEVNIETFSTMLELFSFVESEFDELNTQGSARATQ